MTTRATYRNQSHYAAEGWSSTPKRTFSALAGHLDARRIKLDGAILDVGCAAGELVGYLANVRPATRFTGIDVAQDLLEVARRKLPEASFEMASALALPETLTARFDVVCSLGCMSIFDETEIAGFWDNLLRVAKPGGWVVVLAPLNEHGVDTLIRHRKRIAGNTGLWETGWNVYSIETIKELLSARGLDREIEPFQIDIDLDPREDPVRTWTVPMRGKERQLINGLKLMIDHYFIFARRPPMPAAEGE